MSRLSTLHTVVFAFVFVLLAALPAAADDGTPACTAAPGTDLAAVDQVWSPAPMAAGEIGDPGAQATCFADCWDGSVLRCEGSACSSRDSDCSIGERGYCQVEGSPFKQTCPACPSEGCETTATCDNGGTAYCVGENQCFAVHGCYAYCDGLFVWCYGQSAETCPLP